jgi:hypothetical protein
MRKESANMVNRRQMVIGSAALAAALTLPALSAPPARAGLSFAAPIVPGATRATWDGCGLMPVRMLLHKRDGSREWMQYIVGGTDEEDDPWGSYGPGWTMGSDYHKARAEGLERHLRNHALFPDLVALQVGMSGFLALHLNDLIQYRDWGDEFVCDRRLIAPVPPHYDDWLDFGGMVMTPQDESDYADQR